MGSPHKSGRGKRPHNLKTSSHLTKKTTMDSSVNTSSHPSRCGEGESYRWITLPSIGTAVKGCHLVPMKENSLCHITVKIPRSVKFFRRCTSHYLVFVQKVPLSMKEDDISIEEGGLTIRKVKEALPKVVKVVSLVNIDRKELFRNGPEMYTREEVTEEGLLWGQVHCSPLGHADSQPYPSEEIVHQFFEEVEVDNGLVAVHCAHGLNRTGYLICRYLIQKCGVEPKEAVARFNDARKYPMRRQTLLDHLFSRGWETREEAYCKNAVRSNEVGDRRTIGEGRGSSLTEKKGQLKIFKEELGDNMAEIRQEE